MVSRNPFMGFAFWADALEAANRRAARTGRRQVVRRYAPRAWFVFEVGR